MKHILVLWCLTVISLPSWACYFVDPLKIPPEPMSFDNIRVERINEQESLVKYSNGQVIGKINTELLAKQSFKKLEMEYKSKDSELKTNDNPSIACGSDGLWLDLGIFGVWQYGDYMHNTGFWSALFQTQADRAQRQAICGELLRACLDRVRNNERRNEIVCGLAGAAVAIANQATGVLVGAACLGGNYYYSRHEEDMCLQAYYRCVQIGSNSHRIYHPVIHLAQNKLVESAT